MIVNKQLDEKMKTSSSFQKQMQKVQQNYRVLCQQAHYSDLSQIKKRLLSKYDNHNNPFDIYFFYQKYQEEGNKTLLYFVQNFPRPKKPYVLVYLNDGIATNSFNDFKSMLGLMPIDFFLQLEKIFLVKASFRNKASGFLTFGTVARFINSKIFCFDTLDELCENVGLKIEDLFKFLPLEVRQIYIDKEEQQKILASKKMVSTGHSTTHSVQSKNVPEKLEISSYDVGESGIPQIFEMLVIYFKHHQEGLKAEGLFRKSVSILEEEDAMEQMKNKNYNLLQKIENPHLVANLMKRFLAKLKTPIIPYEMFNQLIKRKDYPVEYMKQKMKELEEINNVKYLTLVAMNQFFVEEVLPKTEKNKMTVQNVGICMAPCIMWAEQRSLKDIIYSTLSINILTSMILNFEKIFGDRKARNKIFRTSYFNQKKKSLSENFSFLESSPEVDKEKEDRKTPFFGNTFLQNTFSYLEDVENNSDDGSNIPEEEGVQKLNENQMKIAYITFNEEVEGEENFQVEKVNRIKSQQIEVHPLQEEGQKEQKRATIHLDQEQVQYEEQEFYVKKQKKRKPIFQSEIKMKNQDQSF